MPDQTPMAKSMKRMRLMPLRASVATTSRVDDSCFH